MAKRVVLIGAAAVGFLVVSATLCDAREPTRAERLTGKIRSIEKKLRTEKDPDERRDLINGLESAKHELGPKDSTGNRIKCQAMWHDVALRDLDAAIKRLGLRSRPKGAGAFALDARLAVRRMAATGLGRGWYYSRTPDKYQFDAIGTYLYNNLPSIDRLFDEVATHLVKENAPMPEGPHRDAMLKALSEVKDAIGSMTKAVEDFNTIDISTSRGREKRMTTLPALVDGLRRVHEARQTLTELSERMKAGEGAEQTPADADATGLTADDKAAITRTCEILASIQGQGWETIRTKLQQFVTLAESGLNVQSSRNKAEQLLHVLTRTAEYIKELTASKSACPEYVARRQESLAETLAYLSNPSHRRRQISRLRLMCKGDSDRRALDRSPLSPDACQGLMRAKRFPESAFGNDSKAYYRQDAFQKHMELIVEVLGRISRWPPPDMAGQLKPLCSQSIAAFQKAAEALGKAPRDDIEAFGEVVSEAGGLAGDVRRLVKADEAVKVAARYAPNQAGPLYGQLVQRMEKIILAPSADNKALRSDLDVFFGPFQELADLRLPGPEHSQTAASLVGPAYKAALKHLGQNLTRNLASAARGNATWLDASLEARSMFHVLRHRAVARQMGLVKIGVANLDAFSIPDKPWRQFVGALDTHLRQLLTQYGGMRASNRTAWQDLWNWDKVYCAVEAARCLTPPARQPDETEMDFLVRNLERAADPNPPDEVWLPWAVGYHSLEAAVCLASGYDETAEWHLYQLRTLRRYQRFETELTWRDFDPPEETP